MSDFSSNRSMLAYVHYNNSYIKLRAALLNKKVLLTDPKKPIGEGVNIVKNYAKYLVFSLMDAMKPDRAVKERRPVGPGGMTQGSDWTKNYTARHDWPSPWSDAYLRENKNRGLVRVPIVSKKEDLDPVETGSLD